ncbi:unnamed protein product [Brassicogethes aeneus]|uniref:Uncharacterized protein n=1 Tax=Brassicogethes aeneus TaxID=1431903 RepID=A0A9P0B4B1_BRAAE|nr:unnamed protein product [Brassicogethes aeneus]
MLLPVLLLTAWTAACPPDLCACKNHPNNDNTLYSTEVICAGYADGLVKDLDNTTLALSVANMNRSDLIDSLVSCLVEDFPVLHSLTIVSSDVTNYTFNLDGLQLRSLKLPHNQLEFVPDINQNVSTLRTLDLSNNAFSALEESFSALQSLEMLNLSANSLTYIAPNSLTGLVNLKCLDLSANNLTKLNDRVLLPVTNLQYLNLSRNKLEVLNEVSFGALTKLQQLDVSWNRLARVAPGSLQLPSLARLTLAGNPALSEVLVDSGHRLQTVDASRTGLKQVPAALTHSIRTLRLAGNSITTVRCGDLDSYPLLQLLDFTSNELESVEDDALGRLETLTILYLTDNGIKEVPKSLPEQLRVLHLEHNAINKISSDDLQGLSNLEVLTLNDNKIKVVEHAAFTQLPQLVTLDLSRNPIAVLEPGCLAGQTLRLASIALITPAKDTAFPISAAERLVTLDLSDSPGLARQYLGDAAALVASKNLQELDISRNALSHLPSNIIDFLPQLRVIHLKENLLDCTNLHSLAAWMRMRNDHEYKDIVCNDPAELWKLPLIDIPYDHEEKLTTTTTTIKTVTQPQQDFNLTDIKDLNKIDIRRKTIHFILNDTVATKVNDTTTEKQSLIAVKKITVPEYNKEISLSKNKKKKVSVKKELRLTPAPDSSKFYEDVTPTTEKNTDKYAHTQSQIEKESLAYMATNDTKDYYVHPGMMILGVTLLITIAVLVMLTAKFTRFKRRRMERAVREDIEVNSLPGITELW